MSLKVDISSVNICDFQVVNKPSQDDNGEFQIVRLSLQFCTGQFNVVRVDLCLMSYELIFDLCFKFRIDLCQVL